MNVFDPSAVFRLAEEPSSTDWPLMFPVEPRPDESFAGLVSRAAEENVSPSIPILLKHAKTRTRLPLLPKGLSGPEKSSLAWFLGIPESAIANRIHVEVEADAHDCVHLSYFGIALRADLFEHRVRRIAPAALKKDSYYRSAWHLRLLSFDPGTMSVLIDRCPYCLMELGWSNPVGIHVCEHCDKDLRDVDTGEVDGALRDECGWVARLLDNDAGVRARARSMLASPLRDWKEGQLVDLAIRLAPLLEEGQLRLSGERARFTCDFRAGLWSAERLASAARLLIEWPKSFFRLCDRRRAKAETRDGFFGETKELADISTRSYTSRQPERVKGLLRDTIKTYCDGLDTVLLRGHGRTDGTKVGMEMIGRISKELGETNTKVVRRVLHLPELRTFRNPATKRSPVLVDRSQILAWNAVRLSLINNFEIERRTGLPEFALVDLARRRIIEIGSGPGVTMAGRGTWFTKASIEHLVEKLSTFPFAPGVGGHLTLAQYMAAHVRVPKPWGPAIEALLKNPGLVIGRLKGCGSLAAGLLMDAAALDVAVATRLAPVESSPDIPSTMSSASAAQYLNSNEPTITGLMKVQPQLVASVRVGPVNRPVRASVEEFGELYMLSNEVRRTLGLSREGYVGYLLEREIEPAAKAGHHLVWRRREIQHVVTRRRATSAKAPNLTSPRQKS